MIDLTPLDVRKKKGDFRRAVRGYDTELVDDFLDMVAERMEELVKENVALGERSELLQEQIASFRDREKALNDALVTAQQLRADAQAQAEREANLMRRAERIVEEGQRSLRELRREVEVLNARRKQFVRAFRTMLERYLSDLEIEESGLGQETAEIPASAAPVESRLETAVEPKRPGDGDLRSTMVGNGDPEREARG